MDTQEQAILTQALDRRDLTRDEARWVFEQIMSGQLDRAATGVLLAALATKGECVDEIVGAAQAMRAAKTPVRSNADAVDTCGTGGDGVSSFNVSTTAAIIAAAAGASVAKHGNVTHTRASGSTEVLASLGIDVDADVPTVERSLVDARIGYLNARLLHPAMGFAAPVRAAMRRRTIFNLLGPLTSPAGVRRQVVGVPRPELMGRVAQALLELGAVHAWVVHGADGLCDLTVTGESRVAEVRDGEIRWFTTRPEDVGLDRAALQTLMVDSPAASAEVIMGILRGTPGPPRDHALMNAGGALVVAGHAGELEEGVALAARAIDDGLAWRTLDQWRRIAPIGMAAERTKGTE